jgi:hypothetical protein
MEDAAGALQSPFTIPEGTKKRELKRDTSLLREFDASESQDLLVLYHHVRDAAFDCFNAAEYTSQMLRYYQNGWSLVVVAPRTITIKDQGQDRVREREYFLVCLQHSQASRNILCELSFLCFRQFCGISMLVKKRCFVCHKPTELRCKGCQCACFCSKDCQRAGWTEHKKLCKVAKSNNVVVEEGLCIDA